MRHPLALRGSDSAISERRAARTRLSTWFETKSSRSERSTVATLAWNRQLSRVAIQTHGTEHLPVPFVN